MSFCFLNVARALTLFFTVPIEIGGLGFEPITIGSVLAAYHGLTAVFMAVACPAVVRRLGASRASVLGMCSFPLLWALYPTINICARHFGISTGVKAGIVLILPLELGMEMTQGRPKPLLFLC